MPDDPLQAQFVPNDLISEEHMMSAALICE
jgi:hypothetical protein